jgi:hypothetical protein
VELQGPGDLDTLAGELTELPGVLGVQAVPPGRLEDDEAD